MRLAVYRVRHGNLAAAGEVAAYAGALNRAPAFRVQPEPGDDQTLQVWVTAP